MEGTLKVKEEESEWGMRRTGSKAGEGGREGRGRERRGGEGSR